MEKAVKHCSNCSTKYTVEWNEEEQDLEPLTCPFCGFEVEEELDDAVEGSEDTAEEGSDASDDSSDNSGDSE